VDPSEVRELLHGYVGELDWSGGATKVDVLRAISKKVPSVASKTT
jgi:hypothetical protein